MLHLLPQYQKRKVIKEYRFRLSLVITLFLLFIILSWSIFMMPSYISIFNQKRLLENQKNGLMSVIDVRNGNSGVNSDDIAKSIKALKPYDKSIAPILFIQALDPKTTGITINGYAFNQSNPSDPVNVIISGTAKTREELTAYAKYLNDNFGNVKLPLSALANQSNVPFEFRFTLINATARKALGLEEKVDSESANKSVETKTTGTKK